MPQLAADAVVCSAKMCAGTCAGPLFSKRRKRQSLPVFSPLILYSSHSWFMQVKILVVTVCVLSAMLIAVTSTIPPVDDIKHLELVRPASGAPAVFDSSDAHSAQLAQQGLQKDVQLAPAPPTPQRPLEAGPAAETTEPALIPLVSLPAEGPGAKNEKALPGSATVLNFLLVFGEGARAGRAGGRESGSWISCAPSHTRALK